MYAENIEDGGNSPVLYCAAHEDLEEIVDVVSRARGSRNRRDKGSLISPGSA